MAGRIDHLMLNVNRFEDAKRFYAWLMPKVGYANQMEYPQAFGKRGVGFFGDAGSVWVQEAEQPYRAYSFHRHRVGLCEIAFGADSRAQVDELAREIESHGGKVTDPPRQYDYMPGYYAVFFIDPDGLKLELVHVPR
jgi:glyoxylase I family protein